MKKTIFVTGGAGFIGSAVIRYILTKTEFTVINVDKLTYAGNLESLAKVSANRNYYFEKVDICDVKEVSNVFKKYQPDLILHLAAESHVDRSISAPETFIKTNVFGTYVLLSEARKYFDTLSAKMQKSFLFHHVSTDEVYGDLGHTNTATNEDSPYAPSSPYSATKAASDHLVMAWRHTYKFPIVITHCSNNYGPYQFPEKLIPNIILNALQCKPLPVYGDGQQSRDWLYVDDHVEALFKVLTLGKVGHSYCIGAQNEKTNITVVEMICDLLDELAVDQKKNINSYRELITFVEDRRGHDFRYAINSSKVQKELGWMPSYSFESGLRKTVKWYLENEKWWSNIIPVDCKATKGKRNNE